MGLIFIERTKREPMTKTILELLQSNPQGLTDKQIGEEINRPISMVKLYLKDLQRAGAIARKKVKGVNYYKPLLS